MIKEDPICAESLVPLSDERFEVPLEYRQVEPKSFQLLLDFRRFASLPLMGRIFSYNLSTTEGWEY